MNRSANCIRMLQLLKLRGFMTSNEIAEELQTNKRNIKEYRKELEMVGYEIEASTGRFGGYRLLNDKLLPTLELRIEETKALKEANIYLKSHLDFFMSKEVDSALSKILSSTNSGQESGGMYLENEQYIISPRMQKMIKIMETAREHKSVARIKYRSMKDKKAYVIYIHPYEIINFKGAYYCLAYSMKAKGFRNYKFSDERMKELSITDQSFLRDQNFEIKDHIGISGLIRDEIIDMQLHIRHTSARLVSEKRIGLQQDMHWIDEETLFLHTIMEGRMEAIKFILSLGKDCEVIHPSFLREEIVEQAKAMIAMYES